MRERTPDWTVVEASLDDTDADRSRTISDLRSYFKPVSWRGEEGFTGSAFESYADGGDADLVRDRFTSDDLVAVTMLGVNVPPRAAVVLTSDVDGTFAQMLRDIPTRLDLHTVDRPLMDALPATWTLDKAVRALTGLGPTKTSKLLARKRPHLLPVLDKVTTCAMGRPQVIWEPLRLRLRAGMAEQLQDLARRAGVPTHVSVLRVLDITLWMRHAEEHRQAKTSHHR